MTMNSSRDLFFTKLAQVIDQEDVYIVSADLAGRPFDFIREHYPQRYVSVGIAEQNMISVASGIALAGKKVIAYTANPFIAFRAFDQVRNSVSLMNLPVTIAGLGVGFGVSECGTTHFITEDFAMMSLCPNMHIITVSDDAVSEKAFDYFLTSTSPTYIRFDKMCCGRLAEMDTSDFDCGFRYIRKTDTIRKLVVSTGYIINSILNQQLDADVLDLVCVPFDEEKLLKIFSQYDEIEVCEEQQKRGGLGSLLLEILHDRGVEFPICRTGIDYNRTFPNLYGSREYWLKKYGILG